MDLGSYEDNLEKWFLSKTANDFPQKLDYVSKYKNLVEALDPVHKQVTAGADSTDGTTLTWHDKSHVDRVIRQISHLLGYKEAVVSPYEAFHLLVAAQIHDLKNVEGREDHEVKAIQIFRELGISGIADTIVLKNIGFIASCHAGSFVRGETKEKDKIGYLLAPTANRGDFTIRPQFLAALLRLADEYADENARAMNYLLKIGKVSKGSIIHQKHAQCLYDVHIEKNTGTVYFEYHLQAEDGINLFPKYVKELDTFHEKYLLDEIFERTVKSHFETIYCMRFLRPYISVDKLKVSIELEQSLEQMSIHKQLKIDYELVERGYPNDNKTIVDLCHESLETKDGVWSGENLKKYIQEHNLA